MNVEGRLRVAARYVGGRITSVSVKSDRPLAADRLLSGRTPDEALALLPNLYSICGRSHAVVAAAALDAALGDTPGQAIHRRRERELAAETAGEHALRLLFDWPRLLGGEADVALLARVRSLLASATMSEASWGAARDALIGMTEARLLGLSLDSWLEQFSSSEWLAWARSGRTDVGRTLAGLAALPAWHAEPIQMLSRPLRSVFVEDIATRALADPGFAALPEIGGAPAECGALARSLQHPAVRDLARHDLIAARAFARLAEFSQVLREETCAGCLESAVLAPGEGAAMGEMARGLLVHAVRVENGRISRYAIVAPTEWNFHPRGALYHELEGRPAADAAEARHALLLAASVIDPCVAIETELRDA
jgi:coenzyme F420-reducing hydrogenase alpha subunit